MPDIWMDVDIALAEVPVNIYPLTDDTDFKTREVAIAYNQAGMDLVWNFVTTGGAMTQTAVTPTTSGDYDWAHQGDGMYSLEITASGGASINNDTEGFGWFSGLCTGVLPWRGPVIGFRAAALNNALIDGGDVLDVNLTEMGGVAQSATDLKDFADAGYNPATNKVTGVLLVDTTTTNSDMVTEPPTAAAIVNEWESQSQLDPTGFHVNVQEVNGTAQTANDNGADINQLLIDVADVPTVTEFNARSLPSADYVVTSDTIAGVTSVGTVTGNVDGTVATATNLTNAPTNGDLTATMKASVNTEVDNALNVTTYAEPGDEAPTSTTTLADKIGYVYKFLRNKVTTTTTRIHVYDDAGSNIDHSSVIADDGSTFTRGEFGAGD